LLDHLKPWGTFDLWELLKMLLLVPELRSTIILIKFELEALLFLQLWGAAEGILSGESKIVHCLLLFSDRDLGTVLRLLRRLRHDDQGFLGHFSHG
jgi:hypothetical protein